MQRLFGRTLEEIINYIILEAINPFIAFLIGVGVLVFLWGIIEFMANADNEEAQEKGKQHIIWGIVGLFIMVSTFGIINLISSIFY